MDAFKSFINPLSKLNYQLCIKNKKKKENIASHECATYQQEKPCSYTKAALHMQPNIPNCYRMFNIYLDLDYPSISFLICVLIIQHLFLLLLVWPY